MDVKHHQSNIKEFIEMVTDRKYFMDCARAVCALYIVGFWHLFDYIEKDIGNAVTCQMTFGVLAAFTFISGYFLGRKAINGFKSALLFYLKRLASFYPLFVISCTLLWKTGYIVSFKQYALTIAGLSCIIPPPATTAWYLCMLMLFYLLTPLINACNRKNIKLLLMICIEVVLVMTIYLFETDSRLCFYWPFYCAGILGSKKITEKYSKKMYYVFTLLSIIIFVFVSISIGHRMGKLSLISSSCFLVFILSLGKILEQTFLVKVLGKISYASLCAYLFHRPFYFYIQKIIGAFPIWAAYLFILPIILILCYGIQFCYDKFLKSRFLKLFH